jgi:hypothetical protein
VEEVVLVEVDGLVTNGSTGVEFVCRMRGVSVRRKEAEKALEEKTYPREQSVYEPMLTVQVPSLFCPRGDGG